MERGHSLVSGVCIPHVNGECRHSLTLQIQETQPTWIKNLNPLQTMRPSKFQPQTLCLSQCLQQSHSLQPHPSQKTKPAIQSDQVCEPVYTSVPVGVLVELDDEEWLIDWDSAEPLPTLAPTHEPLLRHCWSCPAPSLHCH